MKEVLGSLPEVITAYKNYSGVDFCGISEENFDRLKKGLVNMFPVIKVTEVKE